MDFIQPNEKTIRDLLQQFGYSSATLPDPDATDSQASGSSSADEDQLSGTGSASSTSGSSGSWSESDGGVSERSSQDSFGAAFASDHEAEILAYAADAAPAPAPAAAAPAPAAPAAAAPAAAAPAAAAPAAAAPPPAAPAPEAAPPPPLPAPATPGALKSKVRGAPKSKSQTRSRTRSRAQSRQKSRKSKSRMKSVAGRKKKPQLPKKKVKESDADRLARERWEKFRKMELKAGAHEARKMAGMKKLMVNGSWVPVKDPTAVFDFKDYYRLAPIYTYLGSLELKVPEVLQVFTIADSADGRPIQCCKISNGDPSNGAVWIDAGMSPCEWVGPPTAIYMINELANDFTNQPYYITNKDWYIVPMINPDGYEYSHTIDRMYTKNRSLQKGKKVGVDLNRNFQPGFNSKDSGTSQNPVEWNFPGYEPVSEYETIVIKNILTSAIPFNVYITLRAYHQSIVFPYSGHQDEACQKFHMLMEGANVMAQAIYDCTGQNFQTGEARDLLKNPVGASIDYAHGYACIPHCYQLNLRSKQHKYLLPADEIKESGMEALAACSELMKYLDNWGCSLIRRAV
ncbi:unnamed protein product [Plutella xylostella]|uniref:(diamondback moth) hypothetical protein n=1 Tax=Plutella xylostella TaxID=51655 RepID=A0A8S4E984_PLUXY|nr:unnamed protein product [Plutella xylostella]